MEKKLLRRTEAAECIGISVDTIDRLVSHGHLHPVHIGARTMFRPEDLDDMVRKMVLTGGVSTSC